MRKITAAASRAAWITPSTSTDTSTLKDSGAAEAMVARKGEVRGARGVRSSGAGLWRFNGAACREQAVACNRRASIRARE